MEIHFLGVGEACDGRQPNTSILLKTSPAQKAGKILLDCGFSVPHRYLALDPPPEELEMLWISHFHGDHFFGTPLLLLWFWEQDRTRPLHFIGPPGIEEKIRRAMDLAYPNFMARFRYPLVFHPMVPKETLHLEDIAWQVAYDEHSQPCLSLRLEFAGKTIFYSGDGRPTPATLALASQCDLAIHEAYSLEDNVPGHGSILRSLDFSNRAEIKRLALIHIQRNIRPQCLQMLQELREKLTEVEIMMPETGDTLTL